MKLAVSVTTAAVPATETTAAIAAETHESTMSVPDNAQQAGVIMHAVSFAMNAAMASGKQIDAVSVKVVKD